MSAHWIDRAALTLAGVRRRSPDPVSLAGEAGPTFTRRAGLQAAAGFVIATTLGVERAAGASAQLSCLEKCERHADKLAGDAFRQCIDQNAPTTAVLGAVWFPAFTLLTISCGTTNAAVAWYGYLVCPEVGSAGDCPYDRPNPPPPLPRPPVKDFPPIPTDGAPGLPRRKPPRKKPSPKKPPKQPPKKPGTCGNGILQPGSVCCGGVACTCALGCGACGGCGCNVLERPVC